MKRFVSAATLGGALILAACGGGGGLSDRQAPDEFAITRNAPLVIPPDFALEPPRPGAPRTLDAESQSQAMEALFGAGVRAPEASSSEQLLLQDAGAAEVQPGARSVAGSEETETVNKGAQVKDIVAAPAGTQDASVGQASLGGAPAPSAAAGTQTPAPAVQPQPEAQSEPQPESQPDSQPNSQDDGSN